MMHRRISPDEYDAATASRPACCSLFAMGDRRGGRQLLADFAADDAWALENLVSSPAGRGLLAQVPGRVAALAQFFAASAAAAATPTMQWPAVRPRDPLFRAEDGDGVAPELSRLAAATQPITRALLAIRPPLACPPSAFDSAVISGSSVGPAALIERAAADGAGQTSARAAGSVRDGRPPHRRERYGGPPAGRDPAGASGEDRGDGAVPNFLVEEGCCGLPGSSVDGVGSVGSVVGADGGGAVDWGCAAAAGRAESCVEEAWPWELGGGSSAAGLHGAWVGSCVSDDDGEGGIGL
jgi:hypothetical protein